MTDPVASANPLNSVPYFQTESFANISNGAALLETYATVLDAQQYDSPLTTLPNGAPDNTFLLNLSPETFNTLRAANDASPYSASADGEIQLSLLQSLDDDSFVNSVGLNAQHNAAAQYQQTVLTADRYDTSIPNGISSIHLPVTELPLNDTLNALPPQDTLQAIANTLTQLGNLPAIVPQQTNAPAQSAAVEAEMAAQNTEQTVTILAEGSLIDLVS